MPTSPAPLTDVAEFARQIRLNVVRMTNRGGSSHVGSALSMADIVAVLYGRILNVDPADPKRPDRDRFILSKGHAGAAVYAALALRKFPINWRQWREMREHTRALKHDDTSLWGWQVVTGYALFFLAPAHLFVMMSRPDRIGPFESADRMWSDHYWPLYLLLLFVVELHGGIGLYRLAVKWGWFQGTDPIAARKRLKTLKWALTAFFLALGLATLVAYVRIGIEHAPLAGQPYVPSHLSNPGVAR